MKPTRNSHATHILLVLAALLLQAVLGAHAADLSWTNGTASYNNALSWSPNAIPGSTDNAINNHGIGNVVQINVGDPDWSLSQLLAGDGAFEQNGQTLSLTNALRTLRLGTVAGSSAVYTLNDGAINYRGEMAVGELGQATLNINGGSITGAGTFGVNLASGVDAVNATMDDGLRKTGHTWFERGFYTTDTTRGLPTAGSTFVHESLPDHSYTMAPSYATNSSVMINSEVTSATMTLDPATAYSALSFLGSAGNGAVTINYTVHYSGAADETGSLVVPDWYDNTAPIALKVGGRVRATGFDFQNIDNAIDYPRLYSIDITLANTTDRVTSIDLTYVSGGVAGLMALSGNSGSGFVPLAISGYNADLVLEAAAAVYASPAITDTVNQTGGTVDIGGEVWVGNYRSGSYNLSGGTLTPRDWTTVGRFGGVGTFTMTGGTISKPDKSDGGGHFIIAAGPGPGAVGTMNQSGGVLNNLREYWIAEANCIGTNNISGTAELNLERWVSIGRGGGALGVVNFSGGTINKTSLDGHFIVADWGTGIFNQTGGTLNDDHELWVGQGGTAVGTYDLSAGTLNVHDWVAIGRDGGKGTFNMTGGSFTKDGNGDFLVAAGNGSIGTLNHSAGTLTSQKAFLVPQWGNSTTLGTYNISGTAELFVNDWVAVGRDGGNGILNLSGGTITKTGGGAFIIGASGLGTFNQTGGVLINTANDTWLAENNTGTWTLSAGTATLGFVQFARNGGSSGTLNLDGGTITANEIVGGGGTSTLNFNGGTLKAGTDNENFLHGLTSANVAGGGAIIDTVGFKVTAAQSLAGSGGLTKLGTGTLNLNGANTYSGATLVNAGTLGGSGSISGPVTVAAAGTLAPGTSIGTLTVGNSVTLDGTTAMEISKDGGVAASDLLSVTGNIGFNGTLTVVVTGTNGLAIGDTFKLFTWGTKSGTFAVTTLPAGYYWDTAQLYVDGTIRVTGMVSPQVDPPTVSGGNLVVTGIGGPAGATYTWLTSTNVAAPLANWVTNSTGVFGVNGAFSNAFPVNVNEPAMFFRLQTP